MGPAPHRDEVHLAPEFGINQRPHRYPRMVGATCRHEPEAKPACNHGQDPVVPLAAVDQLTTQKVVLAPDPAGVAKELAIDAVQVALSSEVLGHNRITLGERMTRVKHDHHLLA